MSDRRHVFIHNTVVSCKRCKAEFTRETADGEHPDVFKKHIIKLGWVVRDRAWVCPECSSKPVEKVDVEGNMP